MAASAWKKHGLLRVEAHIVEKILTKEKDR